jgi:integrase
MILRECRALGLTRPGQPMAGLPDDFVIRRGDIPQQAADDEPGRALPAGVLNHLISALPVLEEAASPDVRAAVELLMDTGRRPAEICKLGWDCLGQDSDGKYALIYTDFKANRAGRRLPVTDDTAGVIVGQQQRVRARYPATPASELAMFPRMTRNRQGKSPLGEGVMAGHHRAWVDGLPPLQLEDGREFDKAAVFLYAYRHSFAQRHADAGTPVDVLRDLMGHRSMSTTQGYYSITTKRVRSAVDALATFQFDRGGERIWSQARALVESEHQRLAVGQVAVPFGMCSEPSNVTAGGGACPFRFRCLGCGHFRSDPSYLPELRDYLDTLLRTENVSVPPVTWRSGPRPRPCPPMRRSPGCASSSAGPKPTSTGSTRPAGTRSPRPSRSSARPGAPSTWASPASGPRHPACPKRAWRDWTPSTTPHRGPPP